MEYNYHQLKIIKQMYERELLQEGYRDRALDTTTDPERTKVAYALPKVEYRDLEVEQELVNNLQVNG